MVCLWFWLLKDCYCCSEKGYYCFCLDKGDKLDKYSLSSTISRRCCSYSLFRSKLLLSYSRFPYSDSNYFYKIFRAYWVSLSCVSSVYLLSDSRMYSRSINNFYYSICLIFIPISSISYSNISFSPLLSSSQRLASPSSFLVSTSSLYSSPFLFSRSMISYLRWSVCSLCSTYSYLSSSISLPSLVICSLF